MNVKVTLVIIGSKDLSQITLAVELQ